MAYETLAERSKDMTAQVETLSQKKLQMDNQLEAERTSCQQRIQQEEEETKQALAQVAALQANAEAAP